MKKIKCRKWLGWLLMALVMLEFVRIIAVWELNDKGVDKHE